MKYIMKCIENYDKMFLVQIKSKDSGRRSGEPDRKSRTLSGKGKQKAGEYLLNMQ